MKTCPSAVCEEGANLVGIVNQEGMVDFLSNPFIIDAEFVDIAFRGKQPESRFRFSNRCVENGCKQWTGHSCSVIERVLVEAEGQDFPNKLPPCSIRASCRWYHQEGNNACFVCPFIVTDNT